MKLMKVARTAVPSEEVLAAGIFQAGGSLTARMSGFGEFSVRRREREVRDSSGLSFKRYILLVVTPDRLHVFDAHSAMTRWMAGPSLAVWDRAAVGASSDAKSATIRLTLEIPSENRRLELEAPRARRSTSGEVARILATNVASGPDVPRPIRPSHSAEERQEPEQLRNLHRGAGWLAVLGSTIMLLAYSLPWIVASLPFGPSVGISGYRVLDAPVLSLGYAVVVLVAAGFYLAGRREGSPRLLLSLGVGSILAFLIDYWITLDRIGSLRSALRVEGSTVTVSIAFGVWVLLAGAILTIVAGFYARSLLKRAGGPRWPSPNRADAGVPHAAG